VPVLTHDIHDSTRIGAEYRYGCHNKPRPTIEQKVFSRFSREAWPYVFSTECRFDMSLKDSACAGCEWRGSGERYDEQVRKDGK
jgi:hypothetical protein